MWIDVETDTFASAGSPSAGSVMVEWTNIAAGNPNINLISNSFRCPAVGTATWPKWKTGATPNGKPAWDFGLNASQNWLPRLDNNGQAQPYTWFVLVRCVSTSGTGQSVFDNVSGAGARTLFRIDVSDSGGTGAALFCSATPIMQGPGTIVSTNWIIYRFRNNGATFVDFATNGVTYVPNGSGTAGTGGSTEVDLGNDVGMTTPYTGLLCAIRAYHEITSDTNCKIVEQGWGTRYGITIPP